MKISGKKLFFIIILILIGNLGVGQENDFVSRLKTQLLLFRTQKIDQMVVIHTDKTLYRQGETIWMKGYVTDAVTHALSVNSLELSVQLADNKGSNIASGKYMLKNGVTDFDFPIPADLPSDVYYLLAYTPEMENGDIRKIFKKEIVIARPENLDIVPCLEYSKNSFSPDCKESAILRLTDFSGKPISGKKFEYQIFNQNRELLSGKGKTGSNGSGEVVFFTPSAHNGSPLLASLTIPAGKDRLNLISRIPQVSEKISIRFYPEGGKRVPGAVQLVVFEAKDQLGNPVELKSDIIDDLGKVIVSTSTIAHGVGSFTLLNNDSGRLTFRVSSDIGKNQEFLLPSFSTGSMTFHVKSNDRKNLSLLFGRSPKSETGKFKLVAVANGELVWAGDFELEQSGAVIVPLDNFHSEIASFAVFNESGNLVAQRLINIGKNQSLNISFFPEKEVYKTGSEGQIRIKITDNYGNPVRTELAVGLTDKYTFAASTDRIKTLLNGFESPAQSDYSDNRPNKLSFDDFLLSQNLAGFDWDLVRGIDPAKGSANKTNALRISGTIVDDKNFPVPNALVSLTGPTLKLFNTTSDQHGEFSVNLPVSVEKSNLSASATDSLGKLNYKVRLNKTFSDELLNSLKNLAPFQWPFLDQMCKANYFKENPDYFKSRVQVKIRGNEKKAPEAYWKKFVNGSSSVLEILSSIRSYELSGGKIIFRGRNSFLAQDGALIVIDGVRVGTDVAQLSVLNPLDIEDIRILLDPVEMGTYSSLNSVGVIEITTKRGVKNETVKNDSAERSPANSSKVFVPEAIGEAKYDLKTTLQWLPVLYTNEKGEANIPFKMGNVKSTFILEVTGFSNQRQWIGGQTEIKVE